MNTQKLHFIQQDFFALIEQLQPAATGKWGKMTAQQMVEHLSFIFSASSGKIKTTLAIPEEFLPKAKAFLWSDKEFRENTKAPAGLVPEEPLPPEHITMSASIAVLREEVNYFINYFETNSGSTTMHPAFGELNFEEWVQIHHKHLVHHLKQFELL